MKEMAGELKEVDLITIKDGAPTHGAVLERVRGGKKRRTPVVAQVSFTETGERDVQFQVNTGRRLKSLTPMEEETRFPSEGRNIDPEVTKRANRQRFAIEKSYARRDSK